METIVRVTPQDYLAVLPLLILGATGIIVLMWDAFERRPSRVPLFLTIIGAAFAAVAAGFSLDHNGHAFSGMIYDNGYAHFFGIIFSVAVIIAVLLAERYLHDEEVLIGEFSALVLFSACGMILLASGADLIVTFLGLETMSIAFYVLAGLFRKREASNEAALKYFLLGSFATGFFLYGIALLYGSVGSTNLDFIHQALSASPGAVRDIQDSPLLWLGIGLLFVGFAFKVAAFPFHQWAPDVYDGAPTVVTGFMSTAGKAGAFSALVLIFNITLSPLASHITGGTKIRFLIAVVALASMLYGNLTALAQTSLKRMLAYSSIAHAGYMLLGVAAQNQEGTFAVTIYLAVYTLMQLGAFGVVALVEKDTGGVSLNDYAGLARRRPMLALVMTVMMLSLAGIPPFAGFFGKYYLFSAAISGGLTVAAVIGIIASLFSVYFYLRLIVLMYFREPEAGFGYGTPGEHMIAPDGTIAVREGGMAGAWAALAIASIGLLVLGILPMVLTNLLQGFFLKH